MSEKNQQSSTITMDYFIDCQKSNFQHLEVFKIKDETKPWETVNNIHDYLYDFFYTQWRTKNYGKVIGSAFIDEDQVLIGQGTVIEHGAMIKSFCIIGKNCEIRKGAYLRGNVIIGDNVVIGNSCEIKNSIIMNGCEVPHFSYIGDSILGTQAHISAGAKTSNFRLDGKPINVTTFENKVVNTGMLKFGAIIGQKAQIGCNVVLNPGSLVGKNCWIYPNVSFRGFLESNKILKLKQQQEVVQNRILEQSQQKYNEDKQK